ncbi:glutaminase [Nocardioides sp. JQ2195]|uniref:glutaminase n=1 Tax=Nocardioides sp. JQ2195 TaxID=2592334 RepID=UPI00143EBB2C|nr:glutaminase [Nocardioides sp. JQ2195]QIX28399.1 glutaminase [Nocardioides sp. JQ2195]
MRSPIPDYLAEVLSTCRADAGQVADYIPELAAANPDRLGACVATPDGMVYSAGDSDSEFTVQSMSKPFVYALAIASIGLPAVLEKVDVEPSGEAFNAISLEEHTGRPENPMINAGAILTHSLVPGVDSDERVDRILELFSRLAGRQLSIDEQVFTSEWSTSHRNLAMGHMLKAVGVMDGDPVDAVRGYVRQCAIRVSCRDLSLMAATLAGGGVQPITGEEVFSRDVIRQVLSVMTTCGMYDAAGDWVTTVGIPAKSGVSGGILGSLPGQVGLAAFSPRLDEHGHSVRGVEVFERLSADMGLHMMDVAAHHAATLRRHFVTDDGGTTVYRLQGPLRFAGTETVVRAVSEAHVETDRVRFDLSMVSDADDVSRVMLEEVVRRLRGDGVSVEIVDPDSVLHPDLSTLELRAATPTDVAAIAAIWEPGWAEAHVDRVPDELLTARPSEYFSQVAAERIPHTTVAVVDQQVVGFVMTADDAVDQIYVDPDQRGSGIAVALLNDAERRIAAAGHAKAWLAVVPGNDRAQAFYRGQGWIDEGIFDHGSRGPDGPIATPCHRFTKELSPAELRRG